MKYKEINDEYKPREKLKKYGVENLSDYELISIILKTGNKNENVEELSKKILNKYPMNKINQISLTQLLQINGIKIAKATSLLSSIELGKRICSIKNNNIKLNDSKKIFEYFKNYFIGEKQERFYILLFDNKMNLIKYKELFKGTINEVNIHPREVFSEALKESACFIIVMHNHPSGDVTPSQKDLNITNTLIKVGDLIGIKVIDHIIISSNSYHSIYENMS